MIITSNNVPGSTIALCLPLLCSPTSDVSTIAPLVITAALNAGTSVTVTTNNVLGSTQGNILVGQIAGGTDGQITMSAASATSATLILLAGAGGGTGGITINSPIGNTGSANLSLVLSAGGNISVANQVSIAGTLTATAGVNGAGTISQTSAGILAVTGDASFTNSSLGGMITLNQANQLAGTVMLNTIGSGADISLTNAAPLTVGAAFVGGNLALTTTGSGNALTLADKVAATGNTVTLVSAGTINQTAAGSIDAATVTGSSVGGASLDSSSNSVATFGPFSDVDSSGGSTGISVSTGGPLGTSGTISSATGPISIAAGDGNLTVAVG